MSTSEENQTTESSSSASNDSGTNSETVQTHPVDFVIATRFPEENYRFKWLLNQFSKLPIGSELYSPIVYHQFLWSFILKLVKKETESILFHATKQSKVEHAFGEREKVKVTRQFNFNSPQVKPIMFSSPQPSPSGIFDSSSHEKIPSAQKEITNEDVCTPNFKYEVSAEDRNGKKLCKWSISFTQSNQLQSQAIGKYATASLTNLPDDMLILDCRLQVMLPPTSVKQTFKTNPLLGSYRLDKLSTDLRALYQNPVDADVTLNVGADRIRTHRSILAARSTVFKKIFHHDMKENEENSVVINDVPLSTLHKLIEFLYTGVIQGFNSDVSLQEIYYLYYAADKYDVMDLRNMCGNTMLFRATFENASRILMWADRHNDEDLKSEIMNFIRINFKAVTGTDAWESCLVNETRLAAEVVRLCAKKL